MGKWKTRRQRYSGAKSVVEAASLPEKRVSGATKKERQRRKRALLMQRLEMEQAKQVKQETMDMSELQLSIADLKSQIAEMDAMLEERAAQTGPETAAAAVTHSQLRQLQQSEEAHLGVVLAHPAFVADPLGTVGAHVNALVPDRPPPPAHFLRQQKKKREKAQKQKREKAHKKKGAAKRGRRRR